MTRPGARETLLRYSARGYRFIYFEDPEDIGTSPLNPQAVAVDTVFPGDDFVTIATAITNPDLLRGRMLTCA